MKKSRYLMIALGMGLALTLAGCSTEEKKAADAAPTAAPTATPTAVPVTVTPAPTATPAPRAIGVKNSQSKFVYLTNSLGVDVRELYLMNSGASDWGKNLIPAESTVKAAEQVQMFYTPQSGTAAGTDTTGDATAENGTDGQTSAAAEAVYDMKLVTGDGSSYEIYSVPLGDMEKASLTLDQDSSVAYLRYMSLSTKKEADTRENSQQTGSGDDASYDESGEDSGDDGSYDDSYDDSGSYDESYDEGYDEGYSDESYEDDGSGYAVEGDDPTYDEGYDDESYYDDQEYTDPGYDDSGSYEDPEDYFDDGSYADEDGSGDGYYDTQE